MVLATTDHMFRKFKIPQYQNGQSYLTSHRVCYVDHNEPRKNSVAIFLKDVEKPDFYVRETWSISTGFTMADNQ